MFFKGVTQRGWFRGLAVDAMLHKYYINTGMSGVSEQIQMRGLMIYTYAHTDEGILDVL